MAYAANLDIWESPDVVDCHDDQLDDFASDILPGHFTLAPVHHGGIIIAVDSRASMGTYISSQTVNKVLEISDVILGTMAGGAADCSYWERYLSKLCRLFELRNQEKIPVAAASNLLANIFYSWRGYGLCCGTCLMKKLSSWGVARFTTQHTETEALEESAECITATVAVGSALLQQLTFLNCTTRTPLLMELKAAFCEETGQSHDKHSALKAVATVTLILQRDDVERRCASLLIIAMLQWDSDESS
ncbi:hypothetical protein ACSSS7_007090 [Eimeria intestinalis]